MKPSGPGIFLIGSFKVENSTSLFVTGLLTFSISSWMSFDSLCFPRIFPLHLGNLICWHNCSFSYNHFISVRLVVTSPMSFLVLVIWVFSPFHLVSLARGWYILFYFQRTNFLFYWFFSVFKLSISFISTLILIISFLLLALGLFCSFSKFLKVEGSILDLRFLKIQIFTVIHLPLNTALATPKFWCVVFSCSFISRYFLISLWLLLWPMDYLDVCCLISLYLWIFQFSFSYWFLGLFYYGKKRYLAWFQSLKSIETCFMA